MLGQVLPGYVRLVHFKTG